MTAISLFSGVGGLDLAVAEVFGAHPVAFAELDPNASKVLAARWPGVPNVGAAGAHRDAGGSVRAALAVLGLVAACAPGDVGSAEQTTTVPTSAPPAPSPVSSPPTAPAATSPPSTVLPLPRAGRGVARTVTEPPVSLPVNPRPASEVEGRDDAFWHRLAMCESGMRVTHNRYVGFFQFSRDTAAKVGIDGSEPYEEQRAAAQEWARRIHPNEGTRSGWPVCWWRAAG